MKNGQEAKAEHKSVEVFKGQSHCEPLMVQLYKGRENLFLSVFSFL